MKTIIAFVSVMLLTVSAGAANAQSTEAVAPENCAECHQAWDGSAHGFFPIACTAGDHYCYDCNVFNSCHMNTQAGFCSGFHSRCGASATMPDLLQALETGDNEAINGLLRTGKAIYVAERRAVQLLCGNSVVFSATVPKSFQLKA